MEKRVTRYPEGRHANQTPRPINCRSENAKGAGTKAGGTRGTGQHRPQRAQVIIVTPPPMWAEKGGGARGTGQHRPRRAPSDNRHTPANAHVIIVTPVKPRQILPRAGTRECGVGRNSAFIKRMCNMCCGWNVWYESKTSLTVLTPKLFWTP